VDVINVINPYTSNFRLVDVLGQLLKTFPAEKGTTLQIDISEYPAGVYYLGDDELGKRIKIVKNR